MRLPVVPVVAFASVLFCVTAAARSAEDRTPPDDPVDISSRSSADGVQVGDASPLNAVSTGTIDGTVTYSFDRKRPWRYARIYVNQPRGNETVGPLAEAVVCLTGRALKSASSPERRTRVIDQNDLRFIPETLAVRAGDHVKFTNSDPQTHNVHSYTPIARFDVTIAYGDEAVQTFPRAGGTRVPVVIGCTFHGHMRAWIYVFDHPYFGVTEADGRFRFEDVPPGEYRLEMVHAAGELRWSRKIELKAGDMLNLNIAVSPDDRRKPKR